MDKSRILEAGSSALADNAVVHHPQPAEGDVTRTASPVWVAAAFSGLYVTSAQTFVCVYSSLVAHAG